MPKYEPLELYLRSRVRSHRDLTLRFKEFEEIIKDRLPESAFMYREWWSNQSDVTNRPQARAWINAGFRVSGVHLNKNDGWVRFTPNQ